MYVIQWDLQEHKNTTSFHSMTKNHAHEIDYRYLGGGGGAGDPGKSNNVRFLQPISIYSKHYTLFDHLLSGRNSELHAIQVYFCCT